MPPDADCERCSLCCVQRSTISPRCQDRHGTETHTRVTVHTCCKYRHGTETHTRVTVQCTHMLQVQTTISPRCQDRHGTETHTRVTVHTCHGTETHTPSHCTHMLQVQTLHYFTITFNSRSDVKVRHFLDACALTDTISVSG